MYFYSQELASKHNYLSEIEWVLPQLFNLFWKEGIKEVL